MSPLEQLAVIDAVQRRIRELNQRKRLTQRESRTLSALRYALAHLEEEYQNNPLRSTLTVVKS